MTTEKNQAGTLENGGGEGRAPTTSAAEAGNGGDGATAVNHAQAVIKTLTEELESHNQAENTDKLVKWCESHFFQVIGNKIQVGDTIQYRNGIIEQLKGIDKIQQTQAEEILSKLYEIAHRLSRYTSDDREEFFFNYFREFSKIIDVFEEKTTKIKDLKIEFKDATQEGATSPKIIGLTELKELTKHTIQKHKKKLKDLAAKQQAQSDASTAVPGVGAGAKDDGQSTKTVPSASAKDDTKKTEGFENGVEEGCAPTTSAAEVLGSQSGTATKKPETASRVGNGHTAVDPVQAVIDSLDLLIDNYITERNDETHSAKGEVREKWFKGFLSGIVGSTEQDGSNRNVHGIAKKLEDLGTDKIEQDKTEEILLNLYYLTWYVGDFQTTTIELKEKCLNSLKELLTSINKLEQIAIESDLKATAQFSDNTTKVITIKGLEAFIKDEIAKNNEQLKALEAQADAVKAPLKDLQDLQNRLNADDIDNPPDLFKEEVALTKRLNVLQQSIESLGQINDQSAASILLSLHTITWIIHKKFSFATKDLVEFNKAFTQLQMSCNALESKVQQNSIDAIEAQTQFQDGTIYTVKFNNLADLTQDDIKTCCERIFNKLHETLQKVKDDLNNEHKFDKTNFSTLTNYLQALFQSNYSGYDQATLKSVVEILRDINQCYIIPESTDEFKRLRGFYNAASSFLSKITFQDDTPLDEIKNQLATAAQRLNIEWKSYEDALAASEQAQVTLIKSEENYQELYAATVDAQNKAKIARQLEAHLKDAEESRDADKKAAEKAKAEADAIRANIAKQAPAATGGKAHHTAVQVGAAPSTTGAGNPNRPGRSPVTHTSQPSTRSNTLLHFGLGLAVGSILLVSIIILLNAYKVIELSKKFLEQFKAWKKPNDIFVNLTLISALLMCVAGIVLMMCHGFRNEPDIHKGQGPAVVPTNPSTGTCAEVTDEAQGRANPNAHPSTAVAVGKGEVAATRSMRSRG